MPDPYASIAQADEALQIRLAGILELRAADPQHRAMLNAYLSELQLTSGTNALEVGCGTGAVARILAEMPLVQKVIGIDPSPIFIQKANELGMGRSQLSFQTGDGQALPFADESFDLIIFHTTLSHMPQPDQALREASRVLRTGGWLAVFDGDYVTTTVAVHPSDPLQDAVDTMIANFVHDPWLTRRLGNVVKSIGFQITSLRSHGYTQTTEPDYMLTIIDRGADLLAAGNSISTDRAEELKSEARRRVQTGEFFGHISFISIIARKID